MNPVDEYIRGFISEDSAQLEQIADQEGRRQDIQPSIGVEIGRLLSLLIRTIRAGRVLELGTSLGYSTVWLAQALRDTGGKLTSIECDESNYNETRLNVIAAGLQDVVELQLGDARDILKRLRGPFDLILQDADKTLYPELLDMCVELTRDHGLIVADDTLFKPRGVSDKFSAPMHEYNERVFAHSGLYSTILPIGDGITISVKIDEVVFND